MENPSGKLLEMDDNLGYPVPTWLRRDLHMVSLEIPAPGVNICRTDDWTTNALNPLVLVNLKTELSSSSNQTAHSIPAFWNQRIEEVGYPSCHQHLVVFLLISWGYCKKNPEFLWGENCPNSHHSSDVGDLSSPTSRSPGKHQKSASANRGKTDP